MKFDSTDARRGRVQLITRCCNACALILLAYGVYQVVSDNSLYEDALNLFFELAIPLTFLVISDMLFMQVVASDLCLRRLISLSIFNRYMEGNLDLRAALSVVGGNIGSGVENNLSGVHSGVHQIPGRSERLAESVELDKTDEIHRLFMEIQRLEKENTELTKALSVEERQEFNL